MKFLIILLFYAATASAKTVDTFGVLPMISLSKGLGTKTELAFQHYDVFNFTDRKLEGKRYRNRDQQAYFQTALNYKYAPAVNLSGGHIYQRNNPLDGDFANEHRLFEQVTFSQSFDETQLTHRFRFEQRWIDERHSHEFKTRLRYQIGLNLPLQGRQLDPGEWYFNTYNEVYFSTTGERNAFFSDDWLYAGAGYQTHEWGKIEVGPLAQYSVINRDKDIRAHYVLQVAWLLKFK